MLHIAQNEKKSARGDHSGGEKNRPSPNVTKMHQNAWYRLIVSDITFGDIWEKLNFDYFSSQGEKIKSQNFQGKNFTR